MKKYLLIVIILFAFSCTKEVFVDFEDYPRRIIVNSLFCPDSIFTVHLSYSAQTLDTNVEIIENAQIELYSNNSKIDDLYYFKDGYYVSNIKAQVETPYTIKVKVPNYDLIEATDTIPKKTNYTISNNDTYNIIRNDEQCSTVDFSIEDKPENNFFEILFLKEMTNFNDDLIKLNSFFYISDFIINDETNFTVRQNTFVELFFSDKHFKNTTKNLTIDYETAKKIEFQNNGYIEVVDSNLLVIMKLNCISSTYFKYKKTQIQRRLLNNLPDFQTSNQDFYLFSNIKNGLGVFAAYNPSYDTLIYNGNAY